MFKFDEPIPTKSGEKVAVIWKELQECWSAYKKARSNSDLPLMREHATKIKELQNDLGLTQAEFPELEIQTRIQ